MPYISKKDLQTIGVIAAGVGVLDFFLEGKLGAPVARAIKAGGKAAFTRGGPAVARSTAAFIPRAIGTAASVGKTIALRHPVLTGGAIAYYTYQNRDELGSLIEQGYEVVQDIADVSRAKFDEGIRPIAGLGFPKAPKRKKTKFNRMVSLGMSKLKSSTTYGKKGVLNAPKKAFKAVTQAASAVTKKKKLPKSGIKRRLMSWMRKIR